MDSPVRASTEAPDVLLVEDDPTVLDFMAELLAGDGLRVACARTAVEALALLETGLAPSILVTDINLAGVLSGLDLARSVADGWPAIRLLIISGASRPAQDQYPARALFFTKPFAPGALIAVVRSSDWVTADPARPGLPEASHEDAPSKLRYAAGEGGEPQ